MKTPDITPAQIVTGLGTLVAALIVLFKLNITDAQQAALLTAFGVIVPVGWQLAEAIIRHGRAQALAAKDNLAAAQTAAFGNADQGDKASAPK